MANGKFLVGKPSGGVTTVTVADGASNTNLVLPESGTVSGVTTAVTDNAIARYDGVTGKLQNSGITINDKNWINIGGYSDAYTDILAINNNISENIFRAGLAGVSNGLVIRKDSTANMTLIYSNQSGANTFTIDSYGHLLVGQTSGTSHAISGNNYATGLPIIQFGGDGVANAVAFFAVNNSTWTASSAAATAIRVGGSTTGRSINAAGTINAAGADYAEYEYSNDITLAKGQIVGFKADGTLTDKYNEAIRFAIKSTNPSIVGGDTWGIEDAIGKRPEQPVRKLDKTEQVQIDGSEEFETVIIEAGDTDAEWEAIEAKYKAELADFEARLEAERQKVDRIAYAGKVPVNVYGATAGQYIVAVEKDGEIDGLAVNKADMTFARYQDTVGRVNKILDDGRAEVAIIIH